ncbi:MAG: hypothetical protein CL916_10340 [Deltaproteobacteria bacterium]|nr:hypothetical protein [Deltaproteobacteria bacterium]
MILYFIFACATTKSNKMETPLTEEKTRVSHIQTKELEDGDILQLIDLNQDGQTDVWNTFHPRKNNSPILVKKVLDINHDGMGDIWSYYGDDSKLIEEHFDMNFDQVIDRKEYYQDGILISSIFDADGDDQPEATHRVKNGTLHRSKLDTTGDGILDLWQALDKEGKVDKYVQDTDGDGIMDQRVE